MNASRPKAANSVNWEDLKDEFGFSAQEAAEVEQRTAAMLSEVRAYRLAEVRKRQKMTQTAVARTLGVTQGRISAMENGAISRSEVETLAAHVAALGGQLKLVADFGDESLVLG
ncbi:helix-turn-helix domain-containing protein [Streptomyces sp. NBC_00876]|uniref:XRE family transcriptional regulator n=1 Tax=Streptomyces sp. NBC_00876 TaxID=2975853 RepID=UPI00386A9353|nr:helix-turn-helix domain-containing protein [Streptomyces sp. NBC_00876]